MIEPMGSVASGITSFLPRDRLKRVARGNLSLTILLELFIIQ